MGTGDNTHLEDGRCAGAGGGGRSGGTCRNTGTLPTGDSASIRRPTACTAVTSSELARLLIAHVRGATASRRAPIKLACMFNSLFTSPRCLGTPPAHLAHTSTPRPHQHTSPPPAYSLYLAYITPIRISSTISNIDNASSTMPPAPPIGMHAHRRAASCAGLLLLAIIVAVTASHEVRLAVFNLLYGLAR